MKTSRRAFLFQAGSAPLILGLPLTGCTSAIAPPWFKEALAKMRAENKFGLVIRIPADSDARHNLGHYLVNLQNRGDADLHEVFSGSVVLCLQSAVIRDHVSGAMDGQNLIAMDADGYALQGTVFTPEANDFTAAARRVLHGDGNARLRVQAETIRKSAPPEAIAAMAKPDAAALLAHAATLAPLLIRERMQSENEARAAAFREILEKIFNTAPLVAAGPRLPYGIQMKPDQGGCGDSCEEMSTRGMRVACGMAMMVAGSRDFVKFVTQ